MAVTASIPVPVACSAVYYAVTREWAQYFLPEAFVSFPAVAVVATALVCVLASVWICHRKPSGGGPPDPLALLANAKLVWWGLGQVPVAVVAVLLCVVGLLAQEPRVVAVGLACGALVAVTRAVWSSPRDERLWVEALRSTLLAVPFALSAGAMISWWLWGFAPGVVLRALDDMSLIPLEIAIPFGAGLCGALFVLSIRLNTPNTEQTPEAESQHSPKRETAAG
jgi:hypothetical protein